VTDHSTYVRAPNGESSSLRSQGGLVCPRCRAAKETDPAPHAIVRCSSDGYVFVRADALADADGDPFLGRTIAGRYVVLGKLGAGSMGTVYRARHEAMGRDVAVKILREGRVSLENAKERFEREARALSMLASPHTVTVYDFGEIPVDPSGDEGDEGAEREAGLYLAMELLQGESLGQRLERTPRLSIAEAARVARHALLSLAEAHEKGVIHRDLKPDNLFLGSSPAGELHCKLLDFSIAKVLNDPGRRVSVLETQEGTVFGTPRYMSPEQAQGRALDARSDLYSIGVLLYQMLTGRPPFTDEDAIVVMAHHIRSKPAPPIEIAPDAGLPKALSDLVLGALAKDPTKRPPTARAFIEELDRAIEPREIEAEARPSRAPSKPSVERASAPSAPRSSAPSAPRSSPPSAPRSSAPSVPRSSPPSAPRSSAPSVPRLSPPSAPRSSAPSVPRSSAPAAPRSSAPSAPRSSEEPTREGPEPNSLSSPPPRSLPLPLPRARGILHALVGVAAVAAGVVGGVVAFSLAHAPRSQPTLADDAAVRSVAARIATAVEESKETAEAEAAQRDREPPASPGEDSRDLREEPAEGAVLGSDVGSGAADPASEQAPAQRGSASPAASPNRAFEVSPPPPQLPRRRFNK
jgi:serine/threonine-protein kinase